MASYKIKGIVSAERPCECCGKKDLEKNVVLEAENGSLLYVGTTCAGYLMLGKKSRKNGQLVADEAAAHNYASKWVGVHGSSEKVLNAIANAIRVRYCNATVWNGELLIGSEMNLGA